MKLTKSRRAYKCHACKGDIAKGDLYGKKTIRLGSSRADTVENIGGVASIVSHGISIAVKHCAKCAQA